jgi:hypothetical protein
MSNPENIAKRLGMESTEAGYNLSKQSLLAAIGGPLGIAEAVLPSMVFSIVYAVSKQALPAVVSAAGLALIFILIRLIQKKPATQALVGALAIALAAWLALRDGGQAADYFIPGFITNASYGFVFLVSVLIRYPVMGFIGQFLFGLSDWRKSEFLYRRFQFVTLIWVAFFSLRLLVQLPLYFSNQVELLATSRIIMGAPAYAGLLALTWVMIRKIAQPKQVD